MTPEVKERIEQIRHGVVPEGYTASGKHPIPNDWEITLIGSIAQLSSGCTPSRKNPEYWNGEIPWVTTGELEQKYITKTKERVTRNALDNTALNIYPSGTLLMAMYGQGKTRGSTAILRIDATINQACLAINVAESSTKFLFYVLQHSYHDIRKLSNTGNQENLNADIIRSFPIPWAPMNEQLHICQILTAQDNVIELKEKLLTEKQRQKKYLMQQLLTGKKRLLGFEGEWMNVRANQIFKNVTDRKHDGTLEVLSATQDRGIIPRSQVDIDIKYAAESLTGYKKVLKGNFVISLRSFQGGIEYSEYTGLVSPAYTVLTSIYPIADNYYKQFFKSADYINRLNIAVYGIRDGKQISYDDFGRILIPYPPLDEQKAIAAVLTTADREIEVLKKAIEHEKQKKKALMQLLLTGIVRVNA